MKARSYSNRGKVIGIQNTSFGFDENGIIDLSGREHTWSLLERYVMDVELWPPAVKVAEPTKKNKPTEISQTPVVQEIPHQEHEMPGGDTTPIEDLTTENGIQRTEELPKVLEQKIQTPEVQPSELEVKVIQPTEELIEEEKEVELPKASHLKAKKKK